MTFQQAIEAHPGCPVKREAWDEDTWVHAHPATVHASDEDAAATDWSRATSISNNVIPID